MGELRDLLLGVIMSERARLLCPSAPLSVGAEIIGVVNARGEVSVFTTALKVSEEFAAMVSQAGVKPTSRFRFAGPCAKGGCQHWEGRCRVADFAIEAAEKSESKMTVLSNCSIRSRCRWFAQHGSKACDGCRLVITDPE